MLTSMQDNLFVKKKKKKSDFLKQFALGLITYGQQCGKDNLAT